MYAAREGERYIGMIETNSETREYITSHQSANVGEVYVDPAYRRTGLAQALLHFAENELVTGGIEYAWVEHGTANGNARGFWDKYFVPYQYQMIREIKSLVKPN